MPPRWLCGNSAIENVLHYPRPIVDEAVIATNPEPSKPPEPAEIRRAQDKRRGAREG